MRTNTSSSHDKRSTFFQQRFPLPPFPPLPHGTFLLRTSRFYKIEDGDFPPFFLPGQGKFLLPPSPFLINETVMAAPFSSINVPLFLATPFPPSSLVTLGCHDKALTRRNHFPLWPLILQPYGSWPLLVEVNFPPLFPPPPEKLDVPISATFLRRQGDILHPDDERGLSLFPFPWSWGTRTLRTFTCDSLFLNTPRHLSLV